MKKFYVSIILIIALIFGGLWNANKSFAQENEVSDEEYEKYSEAYKEYLKLSDEEKAKLEVIPRKYNIPLDMLYEDEEETNTFSSKVQKIVQFVKGGPDNEEEEIPAYFNLREIIEIPVKNQEGYGLCWAFASIRSLETNLALHGYGDYDFSEMHVAYIEKNGFAEPINDESGANFSEFNHYLTNNYGPVLEEEAPYRNYEEEEFDYIYNLESKAYLTEKTIDFPTVDKVYTEYTDEEITLFRNKIKKHIMENGSIYAVIDGDAITDKNSMATLYNTTDYINHAVSIIGWDDNYSKYNFLDKNENHPNANGAYIAVNSWGGEGDGIDRLDLIYISYEDCTVERDMSGVISATVNKEEVARTMSFEDRNLYEAIKECLGKNILEYNDSNMEIKCINVNSITDLDLSDREIQNINGIENFTELTSICLNNNQITDIDILWQMENLESINVNKNHLETLGNIEKNSKIKYLYISNNLLEDISQLENLDNLEYLEISHNRISNIDFIENLNNLQTIDLQYNNIEDVSKLAKLQDQYKFQNQYINLSGNPIKEGIDKLVNACEIELNDCNLDNSVIEVLTTLEGLRSLSLKNNNITDVSALNNLELSHLDLSGNKNIELNTIPLEGTEIEDKEIGKYKLYALVLRDCNIIDISELENVEATYLDLSNNPIADITPLNNFNDIQTINLSNTNVSDVSSLAKLDTIILSGNKNLTGLDSLENAEYLELNDCNITDVSCLQSLNNLYYLGLNNNNITNIELLTHINNLGVLNLEHNNIENLPIFNNNNYINIDLAYNNITNVDNLTGFEEGWFNLDNNNISYVPEFSDGVIRTMKNQSFDVNVDIETDKNNRIEIPSILREAYKNRYDNYEGFYGKIGYELQTQFETTNCEIDFKTGEIIINPTELGEGIATIKVIRGEYDGTTFTINYDAKENLDLKNIEVKVLPNKLLYIEGEDFELGDAIIYEVYEGNVKQETTDFIIVNGENLSYGQETVTIRSNKNPELEIEVEILVYAEGEILTVEFPDEDLYEQIKCGLNIVSNINVYSEGMILESNDDTNMLLMKRELMDKITGIKIDSNVENLAGLEHFTNLENIELYRYNREVLKKQDRIELPKNIYQLLTLWEGNNAEAAIYYDTFYYDDDTDETPYINYEGNKKIVEIEMDYENEKAYITLDMDDEVEEEYHLITSIVKGGPGGNPIKLDKIRGIEVKITGTINGPRYIGFYETYNKLEVNLEEYGEEQEEETTYLTGIGLNTTLAEIESKIETNGDKKILYGDEEITSEDALIGTGYILVIFNEDDVKEYIIIVEGDISGDGIMDDIDLLKLARYKAGLDLTLKTENLKAADLIKDGVYAGDSDLLKMARVLAHLEQ